MKEKQEDEERNENICLQTNRQSSREQILNSKTEATLILCGSSGERANSMKYLNFPANFVDYDLTKFFKNRISIL